MGNSPLTAGLLPITFLLKAASAAGMAMANALSEDKIGFDPATTRPQMRLNAPPGSPTALEQAVAAMPGRAACAVRHDIKAGARLMLAKPWRIQRALYGDRLGPLPDRIGELIAHADRRRLLAEEFGRAGHWTYSFNRHLALRQATLALRTLRRSGITDLDALW
jgi:hypothetical protein